MDEESRKRGLEWAKNQLQKKQHSFEPPDRQPGEEPITAKQIAFIQQLATNIELDKVRGLGKWQASELIDHLMAVRDSASGELGQQWAEIEKAAGNKQQSGWIWKLVVGLIVLFVLLALLAK